MAKECSNSSCSKESCEGCPSKAGQGKPDFHIDLNADSSIKHVIGVVSGKGGVGKSMVTASLANQKAKEGYKVGILDADITGPSIPKMYGLKGPANVDDKGVYPAVAANGVKVMSINLLLPGEEEPVIWRGPVIAGTVKQFWTDVIWGDLDYLFVDMPPGTGDVPLTVFQSLPVDGVVIVSSPHTSPAAGRYASISSTGCEPSSSPRHCLRQVLPGHCLSYGNLPECRTTASIWQESAGHCAKHYKPRGTDAPAQAISSH